jgi:uncharacterized protein YecT (DUF1311 family)
VTAPGKAVLVAVAAMLLTVASGGAEPAKPDARDSSAVQSCIKSVGANLLRAERCIGMVADPCLKRPAAQSTAGQVACADRELVVWDDILNETYRRLRDKLDDEQKAKAREMQRAWIDSRDRTCGFYWDYFQGTMASPMGALCRNRETAPRALFLLGFLNDAEGR